MGNVIRACVSWVSNIYNKVISWFKKYKDEIEEDTESFLSDNLEDIQRCEEPKKVGQYLAAKHEANLIQDMADSFGENLSAADLASAKIILNKKYFYEDNKEIILDNKDLDNTKDTIQMKKKKNKIKRVKTKHYFYIKQFILNN